MVEFCLPREDNYYVLTTKQHTSFGSVQKPPFTKNVYIYKQQLFIFPFLLPFKLLSEEDFQKYLQRSLATAESQAPNSFHCRTANCQGWCIYDDEVNDFDCPVCNLRNCLTCKAIHHPVNCKEYQDGLKRNSQNDEDARKTQEYLEVTALSTTTQRLKLRLHTAINRADFVS